MGEESKVRVTARQNNQPRTVIPAYPEMTAALPHPLDCGVLDDVL